MINSKIEMDLNDEQVYAATGMTKRVFDLFCSIPVFMVTLPVICLVAILIRIESPGNPFFIQERLGLNGKLFTIYKFRTMIEGAEEAGLSIKNDQDYRITKLGKFLRSTSLDELPQLVNIIKGDMSIVGPRPPVVYHPYNGYNAYPPLLRKRFLVKPGVTGLAQVTLRNSGTWEERIEKDLEYITNYSFKTDIQIIGKTIVVVLKRTSIYS